MKAKQLFTLPLAGLALAAITTTAVAYIDPGAPSASHHMEEMAAEIHDYLHDGYPSSYGSHGLETAADVLHSTLHDWANGTATEAEVVADFAALKAAWKQFKMQIHMVQVLNKGDVGLDARYVATKDAYKDLRWLLRQAQG